ncbi:MAG: DUF190 domain-containing protein [Formivibrio sp.]|nr:DUF190 domain-containing protein [Formivibrio sp.]
MQGYQLTFFTQQDRRHKGMALGDWLVHLAKELGLQGATLFSGGEGIGRHHHLHSARFFDLADQPIEIVMVVTLAESEILFERLTLEDVHLFYVKTPVEFGMLGESNQ